MARKRRLRSRNGPARICEIYAETRLQDNAFHRYGCHIDNLGRHAAKGDDDDHQKDADHLGGAVDINRRPVFRVGGKSNPATWDDLYHQL